MRITLLAITVMLGVLVTPPAHCEVTIQLRPGMPAVQGNAAPVLWAHLPDADRIRPGMHITPARPFEWVFAPGQPASVTVSSDAPEPGRVLLTVWDWNKTPIVQRSLTTPCRELVHFEVEGRGTYLLTLDEMKGSECTARLARSFSVCPSNQAQQAAWRNSEFLPGCCSFPGRQHWKNDFGPANPPGLSEAEARERDAELSARLGLVLVRPDLPATWSAQDQPIDFALSDQCMKCWTDRGFQLALQIFPPSPPDWTLMPQYAGVKDPMWRYPRKESVVRAFTQAVAARYGKNSAFIEVYNEPDNTDFWRGTVAEFVQTHGWMAESIRGGAPGVPIITGGLCLMDPERTGLIAAGVRNEVTGVGYHSHGGIAALESSLTTMRAVHAAAGYIRPVFYNTEMGYANWRLDMERDSAAANVQKLLYCWAHGNRAALLYCSRDIGGPRSVGDWGFLDYTFCPRFSYGAVAAFCDLYAGARRDTILVERNGLYAYRFRKGGQMLVPVFVAQEGARKIRFKTDAKGVSVVDAMGNNRPAKLEGGRVEVTAELYPQTLVLDGATHVDIEE